jgi:hypothetical protein
VHHLVGGGGGICNSHLLRRREVSMRCGYSNNSSFLFGGIGRVWVGIGKWGRGIGGKQSACTGTTEGKGNDIRQNGRLRQWSRVRLSPAFPQDIGFGRDLFSFYNVVSLRSSVHTLATQGGCWCCWCCVPDGVNPLTWFEAGRVTSYLVCHTKPCSGKKPGQDGTGKRSLLQPRQMGTGGITEWTSGRS